MFASGFHKLAFWFGIASIAVWACVFNEWWGGEWWGLVLAIALAVPVGLIFSVLPSMLLGTLRQLSFLNDAALTWLFIGLGILVVAYAIVALDGTSLAIVALCGAALAIGGWSLFLLRLNAMRYRASIGEASDDGVRFLDELDERMR